MRRSSQRGAGVPALAMLLLQLLSVSSFFCTLTLAAKRQDFKTCAQAGFCRRHRALADRASLAGDAWESPFALAAQPTLDDEQAVLRAQVSNAVAPQGIRFELAIALGSDGRTARVFMDEKDGLRQRYNETASWVLLPGQPALAKASEIKLESGQGKSTLSWATKSKKDGASYKLVLTHEPLKLDFFDPKNELLMTVNGRGLLNMEHYRVRKEDKVKQVADADAVAAEQQEHDQTVLANDNRFKGFVDETEDGFWGERFAGKFDPKIKGPEALSVDISFPGFQHVYGIPQHASSLSLKATRGGDGAYTDPYRLYNADVHYYDTDSEMSIYGSIPFMQAHRPGATVGVFDAVASETWVDIEKPASGVDTHWMSETGVLDLFFFLGPSPSDVMEQYGRLTGTTSLPAYFAVGHHQCRWNYLDVDDVLDVSRRFDEADIPMDVMWLDIEYSHEHKYFIWEPHHFAEPERMLQGLADRGRQLVAIVDPHLKRDDEYYVYREGKELDVFVKDADGKEYEGWCWPGNSVWLDAFNPASWDWWIKLFSFERFKGSASNLHLWNDMNEPAIFNAPEITMAKDALHHGGWEHRDVHNLNGMMFHNISMQGMRAREDPPKRPFTLTRSFFAGTQRIGASWTGDNMGDWPHLQSTVPMMLANGVAGMAFCGGDVGGFFGNPEPEMLVRWYQIGTFSPFFRAHAHIDTKRREPYLFDEPIRGYIRDAIRLRYQILPTMYTAFYETAETGVPILRPHYVVFPNDPVGFAIDDQFFLGSSGLLVKPVAEEGARHADIYLGPEEEPYYHFLTDDIYFSTSPSNIVSVPADLGSIPVLQRGGSIVSRRDVVRRSAPLQLKDPVTLVAAISRTNRAKGTLYLDDGESLNVGDYAYRSFSIEASGPNELQIASDEISSGAKGGSTLSDVLIGQIVIKGLINKPRCIKLAGQEQGLDFEWKEGKRTWGKTANVLVIKDAHVPAVEDWRVQMSFGAGRKCDSVPALSREEQLQSPLCAPGHFRCENKGFVPSCILTSRVGDGICDCCDGSDEPGGACADTCAKEAAEHKRAKAEEERNFKAGSKIRESYVKHGAKEQERLRAAVEAKLVNIKELEQRESAAKRALERAESAAADDIERLKDSRLFQRISEMQEAIKSLRSERERLHDDIENLSGILSQLKRDFNPNYQDMAVLGATRAFTEWSDVRDGGNHDDAPALNVRQLTALEGEDALELMDSINTRVGKPRFTTKQILRIEEYLPPQWKPLYRQYKQQVVDVLTKLGVVPPVSEERADVTAARHRHQDAERALSSAKREMETDQKDLERDWGTEWEWKKLDGECVERDLGEYTYSVCFFGEAHQKSNNNKMRTSLGKFKGWNDTAEAGSSAYYSKQVYADGQRCWNGPPRSAKVHLTCGPKNELVKVTEPEKCEYQFMVTSPAVCVRAPESTMVKHEEL